MNVLCVVEQWRSEVYRGLFPLAEKTWRKPRLDGYPSTSKHALPVGDWRVLPTDERGIIINRWWGALATYRPAAGRTFSQHPV